MKPRRKNIIMKSPDLFDKKRVQVFSTITGDFVYYERDGQKFSINEQPPEPEPEIKDKNQLNIFEL
jgi:hypothetical protein